MPARSIRGVLSQDAARLAAAQGLDAGSARIEVQVLLQKAVNLSRAQILAYPEGNLTGPEQRAYEELLRRRLAGEPVAYILGEREFYGLTFRVTPATLIPRPETELLVELALERIGKGAARRVLDLGTGSGAIALAIAHHRPAAQILACDASEAALAVARENAQRLGLPNAAFVQGNWYEMLDGQRFDLVVSNPPYVAEGDPHLGLGDLRFEPAAALSSGADGLRDIRQVVNEAPRHLEDGCWLFLEHGCDQGEAVRTLLQQAGFAGVFTARDLAGLERTSGGQLARANG